MPFLLISNHIIIDNTNKKRGIYKKNTYVVAIEKSLNHFFSQCINNKCGPRQASHRRYFVVLTP